MKMDLNRMSQARSIWNGIKQTLVTFRLNRIQRMSFETGTLVVPVLVNFPIDFQAHQVIMLFNRNSFTSFQL